MNPQALAKSIEEFITASPQAVVLEGGEVIFDFASAKYSLSPEHGKCLLHLWSEERNTVRRVLHAEIVCGFTQKMKVGTVTVKV